MNAEERTRDAITITRALFKMALTSPFTMASMTAFETDPDDIEDQVLAILCYLEKTRPVNPEEAEAPR